MATGFYPVINGTTRKAKANYAVVGGSTRKIGKMYAVVDGKTRLIWSGGGLDYIFAGIVSGYIYTSSSQEYVKVNTYLRNGDTITSNGNQDIYNSVTGYEIHTCSKDGNYFVTKRISDYNIYKWDSDANKYVYSYKFNTDDIETDANVYSVSIGRHYMIFNKDASYFVIAAEYDKGTSTKQGRVAGLFLYKNNGDSATFVKKIQLLDVGISSLNVDYFYCGLNDDWTYITLQFAYNSSSKVGYHSMLYSMDSNYNITNVLDLNANYSYSSSDDFPIILNCDKINYPYVIMETPTVFDEEDTYYYNPSKLYYINGNTATSVVNLSSSSSNSIYGKREFVQSYDKKNLYISYGKNTNTNLSLRSYLCDGATVTYLGNYAVNGFVSINSTSLVTIDKGGYIEEFSDGIHALTGEYKSNSGYYSNMAYISSVSKDSNGCITGITKNTTTSIDVRNGEIYVINPEY